MQAKAPLSAMDIFTKAEQEGVEIWLSTVYRILDLFVEKGLIEKHIISGSDMALYELKEKKHKHYAICIGCQKMIVLDKCPISRDISIEDFQITDHKVEIHGYCGSCSQ
jgi:Fur family ferric uptake transcriptional regulator